jgi:two-component system, OmpR family, sensor kinase
VRRLSLRLRLTLAFALVMALVLGVTGLFVYRFFRSDLNTSIDNSLRSRSEAVAALVRDADGPSDVSLRGVAGDPDDFAQVLMPDGAPIASTPEIGRRRLLGSGTLRRALAGPVVVEHAQVPALDGRLRMRVVPVKIPGGPLLVSVGTSLGQRDDSLRTLALLLAGGGAAALLLASVAGYGVATGALRPVEAMRRRAAAISLRERGERLPLPPSSDEIARLGETLNEMLARLEAAFERERAFTADASHELRTPLAILKSELELALREGRSPEELRAALESAAEETDRLVRLSEDLLAIARLEDGRLPLRTAPLDAVELASATASRFDSRALEEGRSVRALPGEPIAFQGDRARLDQALGNLVDNALRHGEGDIELAALARDSVVELHVRDHGPGFPPGFIDSAFERFTRADGARSRGGAGLGLAIVAAVAESHGGGAHAANLPAGGADVWLELSPS